LKPFLIDNSSNAGKIRVMKTLALLACALLLSACGSVISRELALEADRGATIASVQAAPDAYRGRTVVWGGIIVSSENLEATTEIEVLETELTADDRPRDYASRGRFLVEATGFLDSAVFRPGKRMTVAGEVKGITVRKIGRMDYPYPVITPIEIKLFEGPRVAPPLPEPGPWWWGPPYGPYYPYGPYRYPYPWPPAAPPVPPVPPGLPSPPVPPAP
jgi:outer membrane lipoprotein